MGWYHSHPGFGCWLSGVDMQTQTSFEQLNKRAVSWTRPTYMLLFIYMNAYLLCAIHVYRQLLSSTLCRVSRERCVVWYSLIYSDSIESSYFRFLTLFVSVRVRFFLFLFFVYPLLMSTCLR